MTIIRLRRVVLAFVLGVPLVAVSGCEPVSGGGGAVYYDSMLWNDYYGRPDVRPPRPGRPVHPIAPAPPRPKPPGVRPPIARPLPARPPAGRPGGGRGGRR